MANRFMEISRLVQSPDNIRKDMGDALELAREHFQSKYLRRIQKTVESERMRVLENPPREVALIAALKDFAPPESHEGYDRMAELFIMLSSWKEIRRNLEVSQDGFSRAYSREAHMAQARFAGTQRGGGNSRNLHQEMDCNVDGFDDSIHPDGIYDIDRECSAGSRYNGGRLAEMMFLLSMLSK
ncbi:MAG: hypothetical protein FWE20_09170 [Defluviitaleaceae bacterium]|nr:hypothetical protein [Defluviitaleaceae bacterium]